MIVKKYSLYLRRIFCKVKNEKTLGKKGTSR